MGKDTMGQDTEQPPFHMQPCGAERRAGWGGDSRRQRRWRAAQVETELLANDEGFRCSFVVLLYGSAAQGVD